MNDRHAVVALSSYLEHLLQRHGLLDEKGEVTMADGAYLPAELQYKLDGFIENVAELKGLIKIGRDARRGEPLSPAVVSAAKLMAEEICRALAEDEPLPDARLH